MHGPAAWLCASGCGPGLVVEPELVVVPELVSLRVDYMYITATLA